MKHSIARLIIPCTSLLASCAFDVIHVEQAPAHLDSESSCKHAFVLSEKADVLPSGGYKRTLHPGTSWHCIGRIEQGSVYSTKDQILTVEASNIYEAYIVLSSTQLVGFYLPIERTFSPLENPIQLVIQERITGDEQNIDGGKK